MTAVARVALAAALVLAGSLAMLWAGTGPGGLAGMARLLVMTAAVTAAGLALPALRPRRPGPQPLTAGQLEAARRLAASARADSHLAVERYAGEAVPGYQEGDDRE